MRASALFLAASLLSAAAAAHAALQLPFAAQLEAVIEQGEIEGQPVQVARFRSALSPTEVERAVSSEWRAAAGASVVELSVPGWRVLSAWTPEGIRTLQFRAAGPGAEGVISVWPHAAPASAASSSPGGSAARALLPSGARVLRQLSSVDAGRRAQTVIARLPASPAWLDQAIGARLQEQGYRREAVLGGPSQRGIARLYRRPGAEVAYTVASSGDGDAEVVMHLIGEPR